MHFCFPTNTRPESFCGRGLDGARASQRSQSRKRRHSYFRFVSLYKHTVTSCPQRRTEVEAMKLFVCAVLLLLPVARAKPFPPNVQVYSRLPGDEVKDNVLICHVTGFYPPEIRIELTQNKQEMPGAHQTDLAFEEDWHYHLTKYVSFAPHKDHAYACNVTHMGRSSIYTWEPDM